MRCLQPLVGLTLLIAVVGTGCTKSDSPTTASAKPAGAPQDAVRKFLQAVKTGDDQTAEALLTPVAREMTKKHELAVAPPGSDTASFEVGEVEMVADDGAHVACRWTDVDESGQPHTDNIVWMVRLEEEGWRVAGMAAVLFPGEPPLFLNFEDPEDMIRKQELVAQEIERRATAGSQGTSEGTPATQVPASAAPPAQKQAPGEKVAAQRPAAPAATPRQAQQPAPGPRRQ
ncbi:MAG: nuclear transport factor 2 family protein [Pirellulales bacterium]|nr:nuclear transport factor 2 family protein [Pirellulales bacterium]